jgi:hypothetical protein
MIKELELPDNFTETRSSFEKKITLMDRLSKLFCPCISFKKYQDRDTQEYFETKMDNLSNRTSILVPAKFVELQRKNTG